ncbi:MAG: xanthine dehydrogenase family protein molybdopterin-binding subunit [Rhizobiaceae bacterium]
MFEKPTSIGVAFQSEQNAQSRYIGKSPPNREAEKLVLGKGRFVSDVELKDALHIGFVRSQTGNGKILEIELAIALELEGVNSGFVGNHVAHLGNLAVNPVLGEVNQLKFPVLAYEEVSAIGQPIAAILADTAIQAQDACEAVTVEIEEMALGPETSVDHPDPVIVFSNEYTQGDFKSNFDEADHIVEAEILHPRLAPSPMECRAIAVDYDVAHDSALVWLSTQTPHRARSQLSKILGVELDRLRVIAPDVGGAFGLKASLYPEEVFAVWAAFETKRSVRWTATRSEDIISASHGRGLKTKGRLALSKEGKFLAIEAEVLAPVGCWLTNSSAIPAWNAARILPGPYEVNSYSLKTTGIKTNTAPVGIYRGAGRPEAAMLMERLVEQAACQLNIDPMEIRRINLLKPHQFPYKRDTGVVLDSGNYPEALDRLLKFCNYDQVRITQKQRQNNGEIIGVGACFFVEPCGTGWESATIGINPDGSVILRTGGTSQGHNRETAYAQIAAETLGCDIEQVTVISGDTDLCPDGIGALASRSTAIGGSAIVMAAIAAFEKTGGTLFPSNPVECACVYESDGEAWGYGIHLAQIVIDPDTGQLTIDQLTCLDDAGNLINPKLVEGQIIGGIAQGIGEAVMENLVYDQDGQLITGSLMDYALPRATDMPTISLTHMQTPSPANLLGAKGVGEAGTIGAPAAIHNAVLNALEPFGITSLKLPMSSNVIWQAIRSAQLKNKAK